MTHAPLTEKEWEQLSVNISSFSAAASMFNPHHVARAITELECSRELTVGQRNALATLLNVSKQLELILKYHLQLLKRDALP